MGSEVEIDLFLRKWYWKSSKSLTEHFNLSPPPNFLNKCLKHYPNLGNGVLFATTQKFTEHALEECTVIGGPCISDNIHSITLEAAIEMMNVIKVSKELGKPGVVFIGSGEEILKDGEIERWESIGAKFSVFAKKLCKLLGYKDITLIRTDSARMNRILNDHIGWLESNVDENKLRHLYEIRKHHYDGREEKRDKRIADIRNVLTYLPEIVAEMLSKNPTNIIAAENVQQVKAVLMAKELSLKTDNISEVQQLVHCPVPSISGKARMYRSTANDKLFLGGKAEKTRDILNSAPKEVTDFWIGVLPSELTELANGDLFESLIYLKKLIPNF